MRGGFGGRLSKDIDNKINISEIDKKALLLILKYIKKHKLKLLLAIISMLIVTISSLVGPYLIKIAIDKYILAKNFNGLIIICILLLLSYITFWFGSYWQTYLSSFIGQKIIQGIRDDFYSHLQKLPISFYKKNSTGDIMSRLTHDVNALSDIVSSGFIHFTNDLFTLIGIMIIMILLNVKLALISFIMIPFIFLSFFFLGKHMRNAYKEVREKLAELNTDIEQNLSGIRLVQAMNREAINNGEFSKLSWKNLKANLKAVSYFALLFPLMNLSKVAGEALVLIYGGTGVINGVITIGTLLAFLGYVRRFFAPLVDLSQVYNTYQASATALSRIYEFMSIQEKKVPCNKSNEFDKKEITDSLFKDCSIYFNNISFGYENGIDIIKDLSLQISGGESVAIVGGTGAGKTTLINLLARLYPLSKGEILINNYNINHIPNNILRENLVFVPQNVFLFDKTIRENIKYGAPKATNKQIEDVAKQVKIHDFISNLPQGYETQVGEGGVKLSGGQKQLISFARALLVNPQILILDEATSSVDVYTEIHIQQALKTILKDRTSIIIAHRFTTLQQVNKIAVLENGKISAIGNHKDLIKNSKKYKELYDKQYNNN